MMEYALDSGLMEAICEEYCTLLEFLKFLSNVNAAGDYLDQISRRYDPT